MATRTRTLFALVAVAALASYGCGGDSGGDSSSPTSVNDGTVAVTTSAATTGGEPLSAEPQRVKFPAADGAEVSGVYYPGAQNPAPLVVLFHWVNGDLSDWYEIAPWLQNRGLQNPFDNPGTEPWWDPTWFPEVPAVTSYGVLIVTFRGCAPAPEGCASVDGEGWLADARGAMDAAATLEGVDPTRIVAIGSSIGADAAADVCAAVAPEGGCRGALSLSPGSFLGVPYPTAVNGLGGTSPATPAWCLADPTEIAICDQAANTGNDAFVATEIANGQHGNFLLVPGAEPSALQTMLEFLAEVLA